MNEDVFPIEHGDFPVSHVSELRGVDNDFERNADIIPTLRILTPQKPGYFENLYTPASYRFIHPSNWRVLGDP